MLAENFTSPYAALFIPSYTGCLFAHALFALAEPALAVLDANFSPVIHDFVCILEQHWDTMVDAIETGVIPDIYDLDDSKGYLQVSTNVVIPCIHA